MLKNLTNLTCHHLIFRFFEPNNLFHKCCLKRSQGFYHSSLWVEQLQKCNGKVYWMLSKEAKKTL